MKTMHTGWTHSTALCCSGRLFWDRSLTSGTRSECECANQCELFSFRRCAVV